MLSNPALKHLHDNARKDLLEGIKADRMSLPRSRPYKLRSDWLLALEMGPYYKSITSASNILLLDKTLLAEMETANEEELKKLDERLEEAEKIEGESEISDALKACANYLTRIGDKVCLVFLDNCLVKLVLGVIPASPKACTRKNAWPWITHRHHTHHRPSRALVLRHRYCHNQHG